MTTFKWMPQTLSIKIVCAILQNCIRFKFDILEVKYYLLSFRSKFLKSGNLSVLQETESWKDFYYMACCQKYQKINRYISSNSSTSSNNMAQNLPSTSKAQDPVHKNEYLYKILVIGELGSGKTAIIKRYVHQFFSEHYRLFWMWVMHGFVNQTKMQQLIAHLIYIFCVFFVFVVWSKVVQKKEIKRTFNCCILV